LSEKEKNVFSFPFVWKVAEMAKEHSTLLIAMGIHRLLQIIQVNLETMVYIFSALLATVSGWRKSPIFAAIYVILCTDIV